MTDMRSSSQGLNLTDSVYERLLSERIIFLGSEVNDEVANRLCAQILLLAAEDEVIEPSERDEIPNGGRAPFGALPEPDGPELRHGAHRLRQAAAHTLHTGDEGRRHRAHARQEHTKTPVRGLHGAGTLAIHAVSFLSDGIRAQASPDEGLPGRRLRRS